MTGLKVLQPFARLLGRQRWIRFGIRDRIARFAENPDRTIGQSFKQPFYGGVYVGNTSNFIDWSARYFGAYAIEELDLFKDLFPFEGQIDEASALDVGANVGHHSLYYGLMGAEVLSFEPNPMAVEFLNQKIMNNPSVTLRVFQKGLSACEEQIPLSIPDHSNLGVASLEHKVGMSSIMVEVCRGDKIPDIQNTKRIAWIKIDVEGHEVPALVGLKQTIAKHRPFVFFEWNSVRNFSEAVHHFPDCYSFFCFKGDQSFAGFFARPGYRLELIPQAYALGPCNVLACPYSMNERGLHASLRKYMYD